MKHKAYRKAGYLSRMEFNRDFIASELRKWRKTGKVKIASYTNGKVYQAVDKCNPYTAIVATF